MAFKSLVYCLVLAVAATALPATAAESGKASDLNYNLIDFSVQARREVANDLMQALLFIESTGSDPGELAASVNKTIADAVLRAKAVKTVKVESGMYTSSANYQKGRQQGWRTRAELRLESRDFATLAGLIGRLQSSQLQLDRLNFSISADLRSRIESELIQEALAAFRSRADMIRQNLNAAGLKIVSIHLETQAPQPIRQAYRASKMAVLEEAAPAPAEAGTSEILLSATGTIQIQ